MTTTDFSPAGPDYWFLAPDPIDRLADEECPLDEMTEAEFEAAVESAAARIHGRRCALGIGPHPLSECPR